MSILKKHWQSENIMEWHRKQFETPKRNLVHFERFLSNHQELNGQRILDLACGGGAEDVYIAKQNPGLSILGVDYVGEAFEFFRNNASDEIKNRVSLTQGDWYALDESYIGKFGGVISLETLSWLADWKTPIDKIIELHPKWMAFSSLFYEGRINYQIKIEDYEFTELEKECDVVYYNIYSIPIMKEYLKKCGYKFFDFQKFEIDIDIPKPDHMGTGTYTVDTANGGKLQISAAMLMPWYFIYAERELEDA